MDTTDLENTILQLLLADLHSGLAPLRTQYDTATVTKRDFTGVGFFTSFHIPGSALRVVPEDLKLEAYLTLEGVEHGAMALLFVRKGVLDVLEVVTFADAWPENPVLLSIMPVA